jgi:hypothetical protein
MSLFDSLVIAHFVGDWLLQTERQALSKRTSWRAMLSHVAVYHALILAVLLAYRSPRDPLVYFTVVVLAISHAILDREWPVIALMRALRMVVNRPPEKWFVIVIDQILHLVMLSLAALLLSRNPVV